MCGIIGYTTRKNNSVEVALDGLKNLEYRGYDSAGIAFFDGEKIDIVKSKGKISNLESKLEKLNTDSCCAIAHTRWATHGEPNETNAHPHHVGKVTLVHNGIIENYSELKKELIEKGYSFKTETDTEVATAYIDYCYSVYQDKLRALIEACKVFRGSYAFDVIYEDDPTTIYATRKDSPLVVGYAHDGNFAASDISAILKYTNKYSLIDEGEFVKITRDIVTFYNSDLHQVEKKSQTATWDAAQYQKNGYEHFMLKEIYEQPKAIEDIFERFYSNCTYKDLDFSKFDKIHIVACGSAMHASLVGKYLLQTYGKIPVMVEIASEYRYSEELITPSTLLIVVSQSGETADTLAALRLAKQKGAYVVGIVNAVGSTIAREVDKCIYTYAGPEISVASTKAYMVQVSVMYLLAFMLAYANGKITEQEYRAYTEKLVSMPDVIEDTLGLESQCQFVASKLLNADSLLYIGRGLDYALSMEGSLKLKEISYIHSESYAAGELKHGTISLITEGMPVIAVATQSSIIDKTISNIKEVKSRGAMVILVCNQDVVVEDGVCDHIIRLPEADEFLMPMAAVVPLQLIAYYTAVLKGNDVDKPRNLAKSVTVE